jgi:hypothetical protein
VWLSPVEHCVRDAGVAGSNPATPTIIFSLFLIAAGDQVNHRFLQGGFPRGVIHFSGCGCATTLRSPAAQIAPELLRKMTPEK